jgi:protein-L-isoaspartate(D-aspartate) O-methyltransferase
MSAGLIRHGGLVLEPERPQGSNALRPAFRQAGIAEVSMVDTSSKSASEALRRDYAGRMIDLAGIDNPRVERAFAEVPREDFLPPPPWTVISFGTAVQSQDLSDIYSDALVALDREHGINNGEPALHAAWLDAVDPRPGDRAIHVGAGTGYYTAILATLVGPEGHVDAFEIQEALAEEAKRNLLGFAHVDVHAESAFGRSLPVADVIYVNAGVVAPDPEWLRALAPDGRLIFPWQPLSDWGQAVLVTRRPAGFRAIPLMAVGFIRCSGELTRVAPSGAPSESGIATTRSLWLTRDRQPDGSATAAYGDLWFSSDEIS